MMSNIEIPPMTLLVLAAGGGLLLWVWSKKKPGETVAGTLGAAAVGAAADGAAGVVQGIGDVVGLPRTDKTQCELDIEAGRTWDASFSCPAGTFISQGLLGDWSFSSQPAAGPVNTGGATGGW